MNPKYYWVLVPSSLRDYIRVMPRGITCRRQFVSSKISLPPIEISMVFKIFMQVLENIYEGYPHSQNLLAVNGLGSKV